MSVLQRREGRDPSLACFGFPDTSGLEALPCQAILRWKRKMKRDDTRP